MKENKSTQIKQAVAKIDINKIVTYSQEYPQSKTLRQIVNYSKRVQASNSEQEVFKLGVDLAYYLNTICDPNKAGYVKNEEEKKYWLEISRELFKNTVEARE
jgi:hypothetical protein